MLRIISRTLTAVLFVAVCSLSANAVTYFTGNLTAAQEVPPNSSTATGFGRVTLNDAENQITVSVYYGSAAAPLSSNVVAGHIHGNAGPGTNAPIIFDLAPAGGVTFGSVVNSTFAVTPAQVANLKAGLWYFNIHTVNNGGGEIRGQIGVDSPHIAYFSSGQENPANSSTATGRGAVSVNAAGTQALVSMNWSGLTGNAVAGHVHTGRSGTNGAIVCDLAPPAAAAGSVVDRLCTFSPAQITSLQLGTFYLNIHTAVNPGGEIRGQIQQQSSTVCDYDGDTITDAIVSRQGSSSMEWWLRNSSNGAASTTFLGNTTDFVIPRMFCADYDGDGRDDLAFWRSGSPGFFVWLQSTDSTIRFEQFGVAGDDPRIVEDYDGDGRDDIALFRSSNDNWYYIPSANNPSRAFNAVQWGTSLATPGDYDGDGRGDFLDQVGGAWWLRRSSDGGTTITTLGDGGSFSVPGDYDGDGKTDIAVTRNESPNLAWYYTSSVSPGQNPFLTRRAWGPDVGRRFRTQGDYDGDGRTDVAVWIEGAPSAFWASTSSSGATIYIPWGAGPGGNDWPVAGYNAR